VGWVVGKVGVVMQRSHCAGMLHTRNVIKFTRGAVSPRICNKPLDFRYFCSTMAFR